MPEEAQEPSAQIRAVRTGEQSSGRRILFEAAFLTLLVAAAFLIRIWGLSKMHFWDENVYLQNAELICCGKSNYNEIDSRPPLLSILFAAAFLIWHSDYVAWVVTALLNALGSAFLFLGGRKIVGTMAAAIAAFLLAFAPFSAGVFRDSAGQIALDFSGHSLLSDCPALTLILLSFWLLLRALEGQTDWRFAVAGFTLGLAVLMRFGSLSSVGLLALLVLAANRKWRAALACAVGFAASVGPYLCWSRLRYGGFLATFVDGWHNFGGFEEPYSYYLAHSVAILSWITLLGLALWAGRFIWNSRKAKFRDAESITREMFLGRDARQWQVFLCLWALVLLVFFSALSHKEPRYIFPALPPLLLLAGIGLGPLLTAKRPVSRLAGTALVVAACAYSIWPTHHRFDSGFVDRSVSEEMTVSEFLARSVPPSTVLYTNFNYPDFAYYTNFQVRALPEDGGDLQDSLENLPSDGVLIAYRQDDEDAPAEPDPAWLKSNPHYRQLQEFPSLVLYEYHVKPSP
jgi:4-amino-4-deoxy-L-arabinose transferase-like glycosyltransferase